MALLKRLAFFEHLTSMELAKINTIVERSIFKASEEIVKEEESCDALYIIKQGYVRVSRAGKEIATLGAGSPIGEIAFIDKDLRSATVVALDDTTTIKIPADRFEELMRKEKDIAYKVYRTMAIILCKRLRDTNETLIMMGQR